MPRYNYHDLFRRYPTFDFARISLRIIYSRYILMIFVSQFFVGVRFTLQQLSNENVLYRTLSSERVASLLNLPKHSDCISFFPFFLLRASNSFMLIQKQTRCILASKFCQLVIFYKVHRLYLEDELENRQRNAYTKIREMMTTLKKRDA